MLLEIPDCFLFFLDLSSDAYASFRQQILNRKLEVIIRNRHNMISIRKFNVSHIRPTVFLIAEKCHMFVVSYPLVFHGNLVEYDFSVGICTTCMQEGL